MQVTQTAKYNTRQKNVDEILSGIRLNELKN